MIPLVVQSLIREPKNYHAADGEYYCGPEYYENTIPYDTQLYKEDYKTREFELKVYGLYYGPSQLYVVSTHLGRLEQKKKDLEFLYTQAEAFNNDRLNLLCKSYKEYLASNKTWENYNIYVRKCREYSKDDENLRFRNIYIKRII